MDAGPREAGGDRLRLPRTRRITRGDEIRALFRRGKRSRTDHLDVFASRSPASIARVGVVVPRHKHGTVERNLLKRRLREILRTELLPRLERVEPPVDVLVRARREAYEASYGGLRAELIEWSERQWSRGSSWR